MFISVRYSRKTKDSSNMRRIMYSVHSLGIVTACTSSTADGTVLPFLRLSAVFRPALVCDVPKTGLSPYPLDDSLFLHIKYYIYIDW